MSQALRCVVGCLGALPPTTRAMLGRNLGRAFAFVPTRDREIALRQLQMCFPNLPSGRLVRSVYANLGETLFEALNLKPQLARGALTFAPEQWAVAERVLARGRGILCLSGHTGNWELLAGEIARRGMKLSVIAREARNASFQEVLRHLRAQHGVHTIWRGNRQSVIEIRERLRNGEVIAALIDQDTRVSGTFSPFFGRPAKTPTTLVDIAKKEGASITTCLVFRTTPGNYQGFITEISNELETQVILAKYNEVLESLLRRFPEQWPWMHKRWRSQVDGSHPRSHEYLRLLEAWATQSSIPECSNE